MARHRWLDAGSGFLWVRLQDRAQRQQSLDAVLRVLRQKLSTYPGARIRIVERPSDVSRLLGSGRSERVEIDVFGFDLERSRALAQTLAARVQQLEGIAYVRLSLDDRRPEVLLTVDRDRASAVGVSVHSILQTVEMSLAGTVASQYREGRDEYDIRVRLRTADRQELADLDRLSVRTAAGQQVPLRSLMVSQPGTGPVVIERRGQERAVTIQAGMTGQRDFGSIAAEVEQLLATTDIPEGFSARMGGERQEQQSSNDNMLLTILLAILLVYMIMAALFESLAHPFVILCTIPFALVGAIGMLWLTGTSLSIPVYIGAIMLVGIAVNNGIVMVDYTNQLRRQGLDVLTATYRGAVTRLRPVLITTLTTVLALIPMASGIGEGSEIWAPLGRVVIGGLSVTTLFTLLFIPSLYSVIEIHRARRQTHPGHLAPPVDTAASVAD